MGPVQKFILQKNTLFPLILVTVTFLIYSNSFQNQFLWDDEFLIQKNTYITSFSYLPEILTSSTTAGAGKSDSFYRPTQIFYYTLIHSFFGKEPLGYHLGNTLLHAINGVLVFFFLFSLFKNRLGSFLAALIWVIHPVHTEAVTYMSATADTMSAMFGLLTLIFFQRARERNVNFLYVTSCAFLALAFITKESTVVIAPLMMLLLFQDAEEKWTPKTYLPTLPFWVLTIIFLILRATVLDFESSYTFFEEENIYTQNIHFRVLTFLAAVSEYFYVLVYPVDLKMERLFPVFVQFSKPVLLGILLIVALIITATIQRKLKPNPFGFGTLWFFIAFVPMMGILIPVNSFFLEHWLYFPTIGLFGALFITLDHKLKQKHRVILIGATVLICVPLAYLTIKRNKDWKDPITFYSKILEHNPKGTARVHNNIAMAFVEKEDFSRAKFHYLTALERSNKQPEIHYNLSRIYIRENQLEKAKTHLNQALTLWPSFPQAKNLLKKINNFQKTREKPSK